MMMMKMMLARLTSCLSPFLGFSLSLSCSLRCLSRWRWWRTIRLQDDIVVIMVILIMLMIITMMLVSVPIRLKCDHIISWQHLDWVEMSPQSERVKSTQPHRRVNYHSSGLLVESTDYLCFLWVKGVKSTHGWIIMGWFIGEKGWDGSDPSCHWVAQSKVLVKRSTKDFNLEMCIWKNLSKSRVHRIERTNNFGRNFAIVQDYWSKYQRRGGYWQRFPKESAKY